LGWENPEIELAVENSRNAGLGKTLPASHICRFVANGTSRAMLSGDPSDSTHSLAIDPGDV
jgi:hypothetical protein